jgi:hypothetical protein
VAGGRHIHEKLCSGGYGHRGPEVEGGGWKIIALVAMVIANPVAGAAAGRGGGSQPWPEMEG